MPLLVLGDASSGLYDGADLNPTDALEFMQ